MKRINILLLFVIGIQLNLLGQNELEIPKRYSKGYIVQESGDTLLGYVNYRDYLYLKFMDLNGKKKTYTASKIKGFGDFEKQRDMESFYIDHKDNTYFLQRIQNGKFPLYLNYENGFYIYSSSMAVNSGVIVVSILDKLISNTQVSPFYFTKNDTLFAIPRTEKQFEITMKKHFADCRDLMDKMETDSLKFKNIVEIFEIVNNNYANN